MSPNSTVASGASPAPELLVGVIDVARALKCSPTHVRRLTDLGTLPCVRMARGARLFKLSDIKAFRKARGGRWRVRRRRAANKTQLPAT